MFKNRNIFYIKDSKYINDFNDILNKLDNIYIKNVSKTFKYIDNETIDFNKIYINWFDSSKTINYLYENNDKIELNKLNLKLNVKNISISKSGEYYNIEHEFDFDKITDRINYLINLKPNIKNTEIAFIFSDDYNLLENCIILLECKNKLIEMKNIYTDLFNKLFKNNNAEIFYKFKIKDYNYYNVERKIIECETIGIKIKYDKKIFKANNLTKEIIYKKSKNKYFGEIDGYIDCDNIACIYNSDKNIEDQIDSILNYYEIDYIYSDYRYNINTLEYYEGIDMEFINFTIIFDKRFKEFDISRTIKQRLQKMNYVNEIDINTDIKIIEKQKNKKYVFMYNKNPFGMYCVCFDEYYKEIRDLLSYICNIKNYKYKLKKSEINKVYPDNQYNILNDDYIIKNYEQYDDKILTDTFNDVFDYYDFGMECYKGIIYFLNDNKTICFLNTKYEHTFNNYLKENEEDDEDDEENEEDEEDNEEDEDEDKEEDDENEDEDDEEDYEDEDDEEDYEDEDEENEENENKYL